MYGPDAMWKSRSIQQGVKNLFWKIRFVKNHISPKFANRPPNFAIFCQILSLFPKISPLFAKFRHFQPDSAKYCHILPVVRRISPNFSDIPPNSATFHHFIEKFRHTSSFVSNFATFRHFFIFRIFRQILPFFSKFRQISLYSAIFWQNSAFFRQISPKFVSASPYSAKFCW